MKRSSLALVAVTLLAVVGTSLYSQGQPQNQAPSPARSRADETLGNVELHREQAHRHGPGFSRRQIRFQGTERPAHLLRKLFYTSLESITS